MIGEPFAQPVRLRTPQPRRATDGALHGEILTIDRFGNAITNLAARDGVAVQVGGHQVRVVRTYGEAAPGELVALVGSSGFVEIAVRDGHAAARLRLSRGQAVELAPVMR
jgi:S-adenosylmethionine hydrolase